MEATTEGMRTSERSSDRFANATRALAAVLGVGYVAAGVIGAALGATGGDGGDLAVWLLLLVGGGALVLVGAFALDRGSLSVVLTAMGAAAGALALFWSVIVPVLAAALVVLAVVSTRARNSS